MLKISFVFVFALGVAEVTAWTIDLPEARKFLFEKNDQLEKQFQGKSHNQLGISQQVLYSNREHSNSKHHEHYQEHDPYARSYAYQTYMEKKVRDVVYEGSEYLDGLQRSIEEFSELLENCTRNQNTLGYSVFNTTSNRRPAWQTANERAPTNRTEDSERCRRASTANEHVRRLAELATKTTKQLQDIAYSRKYLKSDPHELSQEENELILKLAWFLDRLAHYTGYHPTPKPHLPGDYTSSPTPATTRPGLVTAPEPVKRLMMSCLQEKSDVPADVRCRYPGEPPATPSFSNSNVSSLPSSSDRNERVLPMDSGSTPNDRELLIASDYRPIYFPYPNNRRAIRNLRKRSLPDTETWIVPKMTTSEDPAVAFMKYFVKHKIWVGNNPTKIDESVHFDKFDVNNNLIHNIKKRATNEKKETHDNPSLNLSKYLKHKKGAHFVKDLAERTKYDIRRMLVSKLLIAKEQAANFMKYFVKHKVWEGNNPTTADDGHFETFEVLNHLSHNINKRGANEKKLVTPEDPFQDLSKYLKHKKGVRFVKDDIQARRIRDDIFKIVNTKPVTPKEHIRKIAKLFRTKRSYKYAANVDKPRVSEDLFKDISYYVKNKQGTDIKNNLVQESQVRAGLEQIFLNPNIETVRRYGANFNPLNPNPFIIGAMRSAADNI